jgi:hypothetical protein
MTGDKEVQLNVINEGIKLSENSDTKHMSKLTRKAEKRQTLI